jgi:uncharacterized iron-regulated protein
MTSTAVPCVRPLRAGAALLCLIVLGGCATHAAAPADAATARARLTVPHPPIGSGYTPHRIYDVAAGAFIDFETLAARAATTDVVFFGERHGHRPTHRLQHALLETLTRRTPVTLSLEMFDRDVADLVGRYAAGDATYEALATGARPWPGYATDYHPLVEHARNHRWSVIAANMPRDIAMLIAQQGLAALEELPPEQRRHVAAELDCPEDDYRTRFIEEMTRQASADAHAHVHLGDAALQRYYEAQCIRDETMAESIARALAGGAATPIVHMTGAFHTDFGDGLPVRLRRRVPAVSMFTLSSIAVPDLDAIDTAAHAGRADYLLFTLEARPVHGQAP